VVVRGRRCRTGRNLSSVLEKEIIFRNISPIPGKRRRVQRRRGFILRRRRRFNDIACTRECRGSARKSISHIC